MFTSDIDVGTALAKRGISRRQLVKFCSAMLATLALPERYLAQTVAAVAKAKKPVLVWLQFQDCTGCSESMLRSSHPDVADVVLDLLSWEYHEVIMAGSGKSAERGARSRRQGRKRQVSGGGGRRDPHRPTTACTAPSAATVAMEIAEKVLPQRGRHHRRGRLRLRRRIGALESESDRRAGRAGGGARHQGDQHGGMPAQSGQYGGGAGALPDLQRSARARSVQPAAVRLWPRHPRSVRAARPLRRRPLRHRVGR